MRNGLLRATQHVEIKSPMAGGGEAFQSAI